MESAASAPVPPPLETNIWVQSAWLIEIMVVVAILILANYTVKHFLKYLRRVFLFTGQSWREKIDDIIFLPFHTILWILGLTYVLGIVADHYGIAIAARFLVPFCNAAVMICLAWMFIRWQSEFQKSHKMIDAGVVQILTKLSTFAIVIITGLLVLEAFGVNILPLVAFGGVGAAAVGFAAKDVIANFFGGLMMHITRPFTIGDFIHLPDRNVEGHVEAIGWYFTSVRDKEKRPVYLPNAFFSTLLVINGSRMSHRRLLEKVSIRYDDIAKVKTISDEIRAYFEAHPSVDHNLPMIVSLDAFGDYSLDIQIDVYSLVTRLDQFHVLKQELLLAINEIVQKNNAEMPYPTSVVHQINAKP